MEFDEYEYLEKAVEEPDSRGGSSKKRESSEKRDRGHRRREGDEEEEAEEEESEPSERKRKKSRSEEENGERRRDERERRREKEDRHKSDRDGERDRDRDRDREKRDREKEKERGRERERERERRDRDKDRRDKEREKSKDREREKSKDREREKESSRRSSSRSRRHDSREREREREIEMRDGRRFKDKKEAVEPEADPERDQRTVFAYQMPLKATERDVYEFFSKAGKVRDVRLIMDRNSRRSKGVGYIEFYDAMSVPMAIALSGQLLFGQPVMVKPSEAEKNLVQSTASAGAASATGPYGPTDRKLYVGNLHFNMTEQQLRQIFEPFGPVELVQLPLDLETGQCKGFGFVQFAQVEHAKAAQTLNGKLEIAGRVIKVSSVTEHVSGGQNAGATTADFDDDEGGGLALNAQSRALLMQKLDRSGTASSIVGTLGGPMLNGTTTTQPGLTLPINGQGLMPTAALPGQLLTSVAAEPVGVPTECLLLKNLFDPAAETDPEFHLDIKEDVEDECSKSGRVVHIYVDRNSAGHVYLRFENKEAAINAQRSMHNRWFARRLISAIFMQPQDYLAKFPDAA